MDQVTRNHKGATDFPLEVDSYLSLELDRGAVIGSFASRGVTLNLRITGCVSSSRGPRLISLGSVF